MINTTYPPSPASRQEEEELVYHRLSALALKKKGDYAVVDRALAVALGIDPAHILQQLFWLLNKTPSGRVLKKGQGRWLFNSYQDWKDKFFPWMSARSVERHFKQLESRGYLIACEPYSNGRKFYQVNRKKKILKATAKSAGCLRQDGATNGDSSRQSGAIYTEQTRRPRTSPDRCRSLRSRSASLSLAREPPKEVRPLAEAVAIDEDSREAMRLKTVERRKPRRAMCKGVEDVTRNELQKEWERLVSLYYPEHKVPVLEKDMTILKVHLKKMSAAGIPMLHYLTWVIARWDSIILTKFPGMRHRPAFPQVRFLVYYFEAFLEAYHDKARLERELMQGQPGAARGWERPPEGKGPADRSLEAVRRPVANRRTPVKPLPTKFKPEPIKLRKGGEGSFGKWEE